MIGDIVAEYRERAEDAERQVQAILTWADELERDGGVGAFLATEIRNRLAIFHNPE